MPWCRMLGTWWGTRPCEHTSSVSSLRPRDWGKRVNRSQVESWRSPDEGTRRHQQGLCGSSHSANLVGSIPSTRCWSFLKFYLFIYFGLCWVFVTAHGLLSSCGVRASHCSRSSCCRAQAQSSVVVSMGLGAPWHVESSWTRNRTHVPAMGRQILKHWTPRAVLNQIFRASPVNCSQNKTQTPSQPPRP